MSKRDRDSSNKFWRLLVCEDIDSEGFEYAFVNYDDYKWITDPKFHEIRKRMLEAIEEMKAYIGYNKE